MTTKTNINPTVSPDSDTLNDPIDLSKTLDNTEDNKAETMPDADLTVSHDPMLINETPNKAEEDTAEVMLVLPQSDIQYPPPSFFAKFFNGASVVPYFTILVFAALAFGTGYCKPELWALEGQDFLNIFQSATPLGGFSTLLNFDTAVLWPLSMVALQLLFLESPLSPELTYACLGMALSLLILFATYLLARATGSTSKQALASVCIALASPVYLALYTVDILSLMLTLWLLLSYTCFYRGWIKTRAPLWLIMAFFFTALAGLTAGIGWMLFPCITSFVFLIWRCTFARAGARDGAIAFALFLLLLGSIITFYVMHPSGQYYLQALVSQTLETWSIVWGTEAPKKYSVLLFLFSLPWILLVPFTVFQAILRFPRAFIQARYQNQGQAWLWWALGIGIAITACIASPSMTHLYVLWPLAAILFAHALLNLSPQKSRLFFQLCVLLLGSCALLLLYFASEPLFQIRSFSEIRLVVSQIASGEFPVTTKLMSLGVLLLLFAYILGRYINKTQAQGALLAITFGFCLWVATASYMAPTLLLYTMPYPLPPVFETIFATPQDSLKDIPPSEMPTMTPATLPVPTPPVDTPPTDTPSAEIPVPPTPPTDTPPVELPANSQEMPPQSTSSTEILIPTPTTQETPPLSKEPLPTP